MSDKFKDIVRSPGLGRQSIPTTPSGSVSTVLSQRHYKKVCFFSLCIYMVWFIVMELNRQFGVAPICNNEIQLSQWSRECNIATAGALIVAIFLQINRVRLSTFREENDIGTLSSYYASVVVNLISATAHFGHLVFGWGGVCQDAFGIYTPAVIWPEWSISVPLLVFITVSVDDKPYLSRNDLLTILSLHICILCGAIMQTTRNESFSVILVFLSCIFCIPCLIVLWRANRDLELLLKKSMESEAKRGLYQRRILLASRKATLATCIGSLFPVFPAIYFVRLYQFIDDDTFLVAIMFASGFTKILFASLCMDAHLEVSHPAIALIDAENFANTSRRAFLRFVFHEVRVPLNSISMGVQVLESSDRVVDDDRDTVSMVREAVNFMGETLNDVMALQKVEEGSLELIYKHFSISELFQNLEDSFIDTSVECGVVLSTDVDRNIPERIIGDKFRIRHVLANLITNALKYSNSGGHVQLRAVLDDKADKVEYESLPVHDSGKFVTVIFSVVDEGKGISPEDQEDDIFQPYRLLKHGELKQGRGTGLGLAICKEIVRMHSGQIWYTSKLSKGSIFHVSLPVEVSSVVRKRAGTVWHRKHRRQGSKGQLSTKLMSHWNVMMATHSHDENCITPSPGLPSQGNSFTSYSDIKDKLSSSDDDDEEDEDDDEDIVIDASLQDNDLFEAPRTSDRAVKALSTESFSIQKETEKVGRTTHNKKRSPGEMSKQSKKKSPEEETNMHAKKKARQVEKNKVLRPCDSSKSLDLSDTDLANVRRYDTDDEDLWATESLQNSATVIDSKTLKKKPSNEAKLQTKLHEISPQQPIEKEQGKANTSKRNSPQESIKTRIGILKNSNEKSSSSIPLLPRFPRSFLGDDIAKAGRSEITPNNDSAVHEENMNICNPTGDMTRSSSSVRFESTSCQTSHNETANPGNSDVDKVVAAKVSVEKTTTALKSPRQNVASSNDLPSSASNHRYSYYRVLIVDDVTSNRKLLALLLNKRGIHSITFAEDGSKGVEIVREKGAGVFDMIFMDNTMPTMSGIEASRAIRDLGHDNLIIGVTGNSMEDDLHDFLRAGADLVITKPMKPNVLDNILSFVSSLGCRSRPNERLVIRSSTLEWVRIDSFGHRQQTSSST